MSRGLSTRQGTIPVLQKEKGPQNPSPSSKVVSPRKYPKEMAIKYSKLMLSPSAGPACTGLDVTKATQEVPKETNPSTEGFFFFFSWDYLE